MISESLMEEIRDGDPFAILVAAPEVIKSNYNDLDKELARMEKESLGSKEVQFVCPVCGKSVPDYVELVGVDAEIHTKDTVLLNVKLLASYKLYHMILARFLSKYGEEKL